MIMTIKLSATNWKDEWTAIQYHLFFLFCDSVCDYDIVFMYQWEQVVLLYLCTYNCSWCHVYMCNQNMLYVIVELVVWWVSIVFIVYLSNFYGSSKVILTNDLKIRGVPNTCSIVPKLCNRWSHLNYIPNMPVSIQARTSRQLVRWSIHRSRKFWELLWPWQCTFFL